MEVNNLADYEEWKAKREMKANVTRHNELLSVIKNICELSGFELVGRIQVRDKRTGKIYGGEG